MASLSQGTAATSYLLAACAVISAQPFTGRGVPLSASIAGAALAAFHSLASTPSRP